MGREARRVPPDWKHPLNSNGCYRPIYDEPFSRAVENWKKKFAAWEAGEKQSNCEFWEWEGNPPDRDYYRPDWPEGTATHWQMYETCSEGTPISPVCATPEELARWLVDNKASSFANRTANYEQWLATITSEYGSPSAIMVAGKGMISGVEAMKP